MTQIQEPVSDASPTGSSPGRSANNFAFGLSPKHYLTSHTLSLIVTTILTLKALVTTAVDDIRCFSEKIRLDVSSESFARQRIHMKNQALFSSNDKS